MLNPTRDTTLNHAPDETPPFKERGAVSDEPIWRLTVEEYHEMIRTGILQSGDPVELLEGWLVAKMGKYPKHCIATRLTRDVLESLVPAGWYVETQEPVTGSDSEPEPDVAIIRGHTRDYPDRHPGPDDIALLVEVSDSTLRRDRGLKKRIYARERVPVYWIVNLVDSCVEVYTAPTGHGEHPDFATCAIFRGDDQIEVVIDQIVVGRVTVRELLP